MTENKGISSSQCTHSTHRRVWPYSKKSSTAHVHIAWIPLHSSSVNLQSRSRTPELPMEWLSTLLSLAALQMGTRIPEVTSWGRELKQRNSPKPLSSSNRGKQHPQCYYFKISYKNFWEAKSQVLRGWFAVSKKPNDWTINMNTSNWSDLCKKTREKEKSRISLPREDCELSPSCTPEHESIFLQSITSAKVLTFICAPNTQSGM